MASETDDELLLMDGHTFGRSTFYSDETMTLSCEDTEHVLGCLNTATEILTDHLVILRSQEDEVWEQRWLKRPKRCLKVRKCWKKFLNLMTGSKGITFTVILQLINLVMLQLVDTVPKKERDRAIALQWGTYAMLVLQIINLIVVITISVQLTKQLFKRKISGILLVQSYFATILLFSGIYTATFRLHAKAWKFIGDDLDRTPLLLVELYCKFLFFSTSTATLCGSSDTLPNTWYTCLLTSTQMLLSFLYFTSVIGHALAPLTKDTDRKQIHTLLPSSFHSIQRQHVTMSQSDTTESTS